MTNWFTTYQEDDWTPSKGFNQFFAQHIQLIRSTFKLKKNGVGEELSTGHWELYNLEGRTLFITIDRFTWMEFEPIQDQRDDDIIGITPVFKLEVRIAEAFYLLDSSTPHRKPTAIWQHTLVIKFPPRYPGQKPRIFVDDKKYKNSEYIGDRHHLYNKDGELCILAGDNDWNPEKDTVISALNIAFQWAVIHYDRHSW
jgi:hypothetical protein